MNRPQWDMTAWLAATVTLALGPSTVTADDVSFVSRDLGIQFEVPSDWRIQRKRFGEAEFRIPLPSGGTAVVDLFPSDFRNEADRWQLLQKTISEQLGHRVERQWVEELLGVPLLMTRVSFSTDGDEFIRVIGLLYTNQRNKMHYRLTSPRDAFDEVDLRWRRVLETIRTLGGQLPLPGDPDRAVVPNIPPPPPRVTVVGGRPSTETRPIVKAPVIVESSVGGAPAFLRIPEGWSALRDETGQILLTHPELTGSVRVTLHVATITPPSALLRQASEALQLFSSVNQREEPAPMINQAGVITMYIRREGKTGDGRSLATWDAMGASQETDRFWLFSYRSHDLVAEGRNRVQLLSLIDQMSVETGR